MTGPGDGWLEPALDLVFPLGAGVEARQAFADAVIDALVIAGLEVQAVEFPGAAPVAAVQGLRIAEIQGPGDRLAACFRQRHDHLLSQFRRHLGKERPAQVTAVATALGVGHLVKAVELHPVPRAQLAPVAHGDAQSLLLDPAPLAAQCLALAAGEAVEEVVEIPVAAVVPVKLYLVSRVQTGAVQGLRGGRVGKQHVPGGNAEALRHLRQLLDEQPPQVGLVQLRIAQQPRPGCRRERNGRHQLRVVGKAHALPGVGPGPVEHVLAVGMALQVRGQHPECATALAQAQVRRLPAAVGGGAAAVLQSEQKIPAQERVVITAQPRPLAGAQATRAVQHVDGKPAHRPRLAISRETAPPGTAGSSRPRR